MANSMNQITVCGNVIVPSKILCVGLNYVEHIQELNSNTPEQMVLFSKPNSAISRTLLAEQDEPLHYETELCFVLENGQYSAVGLGLDLTKRQLQSKLKQAGHPWERSKAFNGAALFTEFVALPMSLEQLSFTLHIDGELTQQGDLGLMIHKPEKVLTEIQAFMTLADGDIVMTGTPKGVGAVKASAEFKVTLLDGHNTLIEHSWIAQ